MRSPLFSLSELELPAEDKSLLERDAGLRERLEARLRRCGSSIRRLSRAKLCQLVLAHLHDLLALPPAKVWSLPGPAVAHAVSDEDVERKYGAALQRLPSEQSATAREKLRRGMANDTRDRRGTR